MITGAFSSRRAILLGFAPPDVAIYPFLKSATVISVLSCAARTERPSRPEEIFSDSRFI